LIRLAGSGTGAVHRVVSALAEAGLVTATQVGNQKHYQANPQSPVFSELHGLVVKTVGLVDPLRHSRGLRVRLRRAGHGYGTERHRPHGRQ
jgi:Fe2+ or Zn2+ uptake regulation protein